MWNKNRYLIIPVLAACLSSLLFFTSLDEKTCDMFLRAIPALTENDSVLILEIDDTAIEHVGIFPWTRDIYADAMIFLREMGAGTVAFDLSFLDDSPVTINPDYIQKELPAYIDNGFRRINNTVEQVMDGFSSGALDGTSAAEAKGVLLDVNNSVRNELEVSVDYVSRDVDDYFARTLRFFGRAFLTLTMVTKDDILTEEKTFDMSRYAGYLPWLEENIALKDIAVTDDRHIPDQPGMMPSIGKLMTQSAGAGFVNAEVDRDGYRRRLHLIMKHDGRYYPHLALAAVREALGNPGIEVSPSFITLKNITAGENAPRDIRIKRARDGSVLLKWPKKNFSAYHTMSFWDLAQYTINERAFANNLAVMNDSGFFNFWDGGETPLEKYRNASYVRDLLLNGENEEGVGFETYMRFREDFLETSGVFLDGDVERAILAVVDDEETRRFVAEIFLVSGDQLRRMTELRDRVSKTVKDALCIVGMTATSGVDLGLTTFEERYPNVGVYAVIANQILSGEFLDDTPRWVSFAIALVLSMSMAFVIKRLDINKSILTGFLAMAVTALMFLAFFIVTKRYAGVVVPFVSVSVSFLSLTGLSFFSTLREKSFLRSAFSRYLAPSVIEQIIADPSRLSLGGEKRDMTAVFTDIQRFSSISEALQNEYGEEGPRTLVNLLNLYLTEMSNIVLANQGTIDKYEGDAIVAFFGAPLWTDKHAVLACRSAVQMKKREASLREEIMDPAGVFYAPLARLVEKGIIRPDRPLYTRFGINTGDMVVGNMGTPSKMDYTIMGNAVNLSARLEGINKQYNTGGILISEYTQARLGNEFTVRPLSRVRVMGIEAPLRIYELIDLREETPPELLRQIEIWEEAIAAYDTRDFAAASKLFGIVSGRNSRDSTAAFYAARCEQFIRTPPSAEQWDDGVDNLTEK
ncbi:MAG: adenylate/guanylate cyclase domain-containing protein [Treponema sp.]|jgi:adenylate cyclase|nr:adenylate/guanylate cyclase domain-containing protein [Treponema sp.]